MAEEFDPYHKWFGIPPKDQPPNHYRLLGVDPFESDSDVIASAANMRMSHIRNFQTGKRSDLAKKIRNEISAARLCLLDQVKKSQYDEQLRGPAASVTKPPPLIPTSIPTPTSEPADTDFADEGPDQEHIVPSKPKTTLLEKWTQLVLMSRNALILIGRTVLVPPSLFDRGLRLVSGKNNAILHVFLRCVTAIVIMLGLLTWWGWESGYFATPVSKVDPPSAENTNQKTDNQADKTKSDQSLDTSKTKTDNQKTNQSVATKTQIPSEKTDKLPGNGQPTVPEKTGIEKTGINGNLPPAKTLPTLKTEKTPSIKQPVKSSPKPPPKIQVFSDHTNKVRSVAFSPDGQWVASGSLDETVKLWDAKTGDVKDFGKHSGGVNCIAYSPDGKRIASGGSDNKIIVWDAKTGKVITVLKGQRSIYTVAFSPNGQQIVSGGIDPTIKIWDIKTEEVIQTFPGHGNFVNSVDFKSDGSQIVSGSSDGTVKIWNASTGEEIETLDHHGKTVNSVAYDRGGGRIVSASIDNTARVWGSASGTLILTLRGHRDDVACAAFHPKLDIASGSDTVKLWNSKGRNIKTLKEYSGGVTSLDFSPDGKRIVFGCKDFNVRIWNLDTDTKDP